MKIMWMVAAVALMAGCGDKKTQSDAPAKVHDPYAVAASNDLLKQVKTSPLAITEVRETMRVPGRIEVDQNRMARVGSPVNGRITDLRVTVGQEVQRGSILATINSTELSSAQLAFLKAQSQRELAARAAARAQQLLEADVIGSAELQRRQSELSMAEAEMGAFAGQLKVLGMSGEAITRLAQTRVINSVSQVVASVSGTVIERKVTEGQVVQLLIST